MVSPLDLCGMHIVALLPNAPRFGERASFSREKCRNPWIAALYKTAHFQGSREVRCTQRDKRGARYAALISAAAARLLHSF